VVEAQLALQLVPPRFHLGRAQARVFGARLGELRGAIFRAGELVAEGRVRFAIVEKAGR